MFAGISVICIALGLTFGIVAFGRRKPGYSHWRHTISELGERGAPDARAVALGLFLPVGVGLAVVAVSEWKRAPEAAVLAACVAAGYLGAVAFPCDPGSPLQGSFSQGMHNLAGGIQYVGGALALARLGEDFPPFSTAAAVVGVVAVVLTVPRAASVRGLARIFHQSPFSYPIGRYSSDFACLRGDFRSEGTPTP